MLMGGLVAVVYGEHKREEIYSSPDVESGGASSCDDVRGRPNEENTPEHDLDDIDLTFVVEEENKAIANTNL